MECRKGCGACCIAPSISSPLPGLPFGKMPGVRCPHLNDILQCSLIDDDTRPDACRRFLADEDWCGSNRFEALQTLRRLESDSRPRTIEVISMRTLPPSPL